GGPASDRRPARANAHSRGTRRRRRRHPPRATLGYMKGDRVEVLVDTGGGVQTFEIAASKAGRRVEISTARGVVEVSEVTRTGQAVRSGRFMQARVVALVEHPAEQLPVRSRRARTSRNQASLL